ncbi:hypothetical protein L6R53_18720 [Myxococcota bacterium]|nr:hypothetical protein [Myxococcota bacterium]
MTRIIILASLATLPLAMACKDKGDDTGTPGDGGATDGGTMDGGTGDGGTTDGGTTDGGTELSFTLAGTAIDLATSTPAAEGLCIRAINPDPAVTGGEPVTMAESTIGAGGAFSIAGVNDTPAFGILVSVFDCKGAGAVLATATPVLPPLYADVMTGDTISGLTAFSISGAYADGIDASLAAAGYVGSIWKVGGLMGGVWDSSYMPIEGATVTGASGTVYYQDAVSADGLFTNAKTGLNTSTIASGGALFLIPEAPIGGYSATAVGYTFPTNTLGSSPGSVIFAPVIAE